MWIRAVCCIVLVWAAACFAAAAFAFAPEKTVNRAVLRAAEVGPGAIVRDIPHGTEVHGQVTLDLCGFAFKSERRRLARLQVSFIKNDGTGPFLSNEVVDYKHGWAKKALNELRQALTGCPKGFVKSAVPGAGLIRNRFDPIRSTKFLPGSVAVIDHITEKVPHKKKALHFDSLLVYQARGNVLSGVYSFGAVRLPIVLHAAMNSAVNLKKLP
ncbi:MAG: hypothetical protein ACJ77E_03680 [Gaiellaceae bacterium]